jgi:hypothetical protein
LEGAEIVPGTELYDGDRASLERAICAFRVSSTSSERKAFMDQPIPGDKVRSFAKVRGVIAAAREEYLDNEG